MSSTSTMRNDQVATTATNIRSTKKAKICDNNDNGNADNCVVNKKSPYDLYFDTRTAFLNEHKEIEGAMLIKGIPRTDPDDEDDEDEDDDKGNEDNSKYTTEQMNELRFVMITKNRSEQLEKMRNLILKDQADDSFMMFNTSFSYDVLDSWDHVKRRLLPRKSPAQKLDILLAFTYMIKEFDVWMHDNEGGMDVVVKGLASAWKKLIKQNSDENLGWDAEYTKPGVMELLKQFQSDVEAIDSCYEMGKFKYM